MRSEHAASVNWSDFSRTPSKARFALRRIRHGSTRKPLTRGERRVLFGLLILAHLVLSWTFFEQLAVNALGKPHPATVVKAESDRWGRVRGRGDEYWTPRVQYTYIVNGVAWTGDSYKRVRYQGYKSEVESMVESLRAHPARTVWVVPQLPWLAALNNSVEQRDANQIGLIVYVDLLLFVVWVVGRLFVRADRHIDKILKSR